MNVSEVMFSRAPAAKATELRFMSEPEVPTEPSNSGVVWLDSQQRNQVAVPEFAMVTEVMLFAVITPLVMDAAKVAGSANVASAVEPAAVSGLAGWVPAKMSMKPKKKK